MHPALVVGCIDLCQKGAQKYIFDTYLFVVFAHNHYLCIVKKEKEDWFKVNNSKVLGYDYFQLRGIITCQQGPHNAEEVRRHQYLVETNLTCPKKSHLFLWASSCLLVPLHHYNN